MSFGYTWTLLNMYFGLEDQFILWRTIDTLSITRECSLGPERYGLSIWQSTHVIWSHRKSTRKVIYLARIRFQLREVWWRWWCAWDLGRDRAFRVDMCMIGLVSGLLIYFLNQIKVYLWCFGLILVINWFIARNQYLLILLHALLLVTINQASNCLIYVLCDPIIPRSVRQTFTPCFDKRDFHLLQFDRNMEFELDLWVAK